MSSGSQSASQPAGIVHPANMTAPPQRSDELDLPGIGAAIARRKKLIIGATLLAFLAALAFIIVVKPTYTADARVLIENQESYFTRPEKAATGTGPTAPDSEAVASQVQLITSRDLGRDAIRKLGLKGNKEFDPLAGGIGMVTRILQLLGVARTPKVGAPEDRMLENYFERLSVFAVPKSRVVTIKFSAKDAALAARGANTIASLYIGEQKKAKSDQAKLAAISLASLIDEQRRKLASSESKVEQFRAKTGLLMGANNALIPSQQLAEINTELATARTTVADTRAKARLLRAKLRQGRLDEVSEVAADNLVRRISGERSTVKAQLAADARTLGPAHPRMKELRARLASVESQLRVAARRVAGSLENDARVASVRVANLKAAIDRQKQRVGATSADQVRLRELELEAKLVREQLETNLTKYREALARQRSISTPGDARIIAKAVEPRRPSFPKKLPMLIFSTLAGFIMSLGFVLGGELLSGRAFAARQQVPGMVPAPPAPVAAFAAQPDGRIVGPSGPLHNTNTNTNTNDDGVTLAPTEPAPPVAALRRPSAEHTRLLNRLSEMNTQAYGRRIMVCPAGPGIDHAAMFEPVARQLSARKQVILIDFSGRLESQSGGLAGLLEGISSFSDVIERDTESRLHLIARGWSEAPIDDALDGIIDALSQTYDFVVMMAPSGDDTATVMQLAPAADVAIIAASATRGDDVESLRGRLDQNGAGEIIVMQPEKNPEPVAEKAEAVA